MYKDVPVPQIFKQIFFHKSSSAKTLNRGMSKFKEASDACFVNQKMGWFGVVRGHLRLSAVSPFNRAHDCLFNFNRDCLSISYRFQDIASYLSKVVDFDPPHLYLAPP